MIPTIFFFHEVLDATEGEADDSPKKLKLYTEARCLVGFLGSTLKAFHLSLNPLFSMHVDEPLEARLGDGPTVD